MGEKGKLVACEKLARFLQGTNSKRRTAYSRMKKGIASRLSKSGSNKKSKAVVEYGRVKRSTAR